MLPDEIAYLTGEFGLQILELQVEETFRSFVGHASFVNLFVVFLSVCSPAASVAI